MRPINNSNFSNTGIKVSYHNGTSVVSGYIVKQLNHVRFLVTDGSHPKKVKLAPTAAIAGDIADNPTYCALSVSPFATGASGATFHLHYGIDSATVANGGSHFNTSDVLSMPSGGGTLTVATLSGSAIATVTVSAAGDITDTLLTNPVTGTRAAGTGATFTVNYAVDSVTLAAGGSGYTANDVLTLATSGSATVTVDTVDGSGVVLTYHVTAAGSGVTALGTTRAVTGGTGTGATFTPKWKVLSVTSSGGSGYNVGDTLHFNGITATTTPTAHISTATSHAATAVTVDTAGSGITVAASSVTTSTTTATFNLKYKVLSIASSGGSGFAVNDTLAFPGMTATTLPSAHISSSSGGAATATTVDSAGSGITSAPSSVGTALPSEYVKRIWESRVVTVGGNHYKWNLRNSLRNSAFIPAFS